MKQGGKTPTAISGLTVMRNKLKNGRSSNNSKEKVSRVIEENY